MKPRLLLTSSLLMVCMSLTLSAQTLNVQAATPPTGQPTEETQGRLADDSKVKELLTGQEDTSPYSTDQPYIKLTTAKTKGKWQLTLGIKKADKGTAWADLNGNERIDEVTPKYALLGTHAGRRTFICNALALGIPPQVVMKWTGHSDYKAMKPYINIADDIKANAMSKFNQL